MMKLILLIGLCIVLGLPTGANAITTSGTLASDEIWTLADSPVVLTGDVTVPGGITLTINPGVIVASTPESDDQNAHTDPNLIELWVAGSLIAQGQSGMPIIFTSNAANPAGSDWYGIRIDNGQAQISYCTIEYGVQGLFLNNAASASVIDHCLVRRNTEIGVRVNGPNTPLIKYSRIVNNLRVGLQNNGAASIVHSDCLNNNEKGVESYSAAVPLAIECNIGWNKSCGIRSASGSAGVIRNCYIHDNAGGGIQTEWNATTKLDGNRITRNGGTGLFLGSHYGANNCEITANSGEGIHAHGEAVEIQACIIEGNAGNGFTVNGIPATMRNSRVADNLGRGVSLIYEGDFVATSSDIIGNRWYGVQIPSDSFASLGDLDNPLADDYGMNNIYGNGYGLGIPKEVRNDAALELKAENNWWGTATPTSSLFAGLVDYTPCATEEFVRPISALRTCEPSCPPGQSTNVTIELTVDADPVPNSMIIYEYVPPLWTPSTVSPAYSSYNPDTGEIRWSFLGAGVQSKTLSYTLSVPSDEIQGSTWMLSGELYFNEPASGAEQVVRIEGGQTIHADYDYYHGADNGYATDIEQDWIIGDWEVLNAIDLWVTGDYVGNVLLRDKALLDLIDLWAAGIYYWDGENWQGGTP